MKSMSKTRRNVLLWWYRTKAKWHLGIVKYFCTPGGWKGWKHICLGTAAMDMVNFLKRED